MREPTADLAHHFADLAVETKYSDLSADAVDAAKKTILDTLGVTLAASGLEASVGSVLDYAQRARRPTGSVCDRLGRETSGSLGGLCQRGHGSLSRL